MGSAATGGDLVGEVGRVMRNASVKTVLASVLLSFMALTLFAPSYEPSLGLGFAANYVPIPLLDTNELIGHAERCIGDFSSVQLSLFSNFGCKW